MSTNFRGPLSRLLTGLGASKGGSNGAAVNGPLPLNDFAYLRPFLTYDPQTLQADFKGKLQQIGLWGSNGSRSQVQLCCEVIDHEWSGQTRRNGEPWGNHFYYAMSFGFERLTDRRNGPIQIFEPLGADDFARRREFETALIVFGLHDAKEDKKEIITNRYLARVFDPAKVDLKAIQDDTDALDRTSRRNNRGRHADKQALLTNWRVGVGKCADRSNNNVGWDGLNYDKYLRLERSKRGTPLTPAEENAIRLHTLENYLNEGMSIAAATRTNATLQDSAFLQDVLVRSADLVQASCFLAWEQATAKFGPTPLPRNMSSQTTPVDGAIMRSSPTGITVPART